MKIGQTKVSKSSKASERAQFTPLPKGTYMVVLQTVEEKPTKAGNGTYLDTTFVVNEGTHKNRLIFHKFIVDHPNPNAVKIGTEQLEKFLKCAGAKKGLADIDHDTGEVIKFANIPVPVNVDIDVRDGFTSRNKIVSFLKG